MGNRRLSHTVHGDRVLITATVPAESVTSSGIADVGITLDAGDWQALSKEVLRECRLAERHTDPDAVCRNVGVNLRRAARQALSTDVDPELVRRRAVANVLNRVADLVLSGTLVKVEIHWVEPYLQVDYETGWSDRRRSDTMSIRLTPVREQQASEQPVPIQMPDPTPADTLPPDHKLSDAALRKQVDALKAEFPAPAVVIITPDLTTEQVAELKSVAAKVIVGDAQVEQMDVTQADAIRDAVAALSARDLNPNEATVLLAIARRTSAVLLAPWFGRDGAVLRRHDDSGEVELNSKQLDMALSSLVGRRLIDQSPRESTSELRAYILTNTGWSVATALLPSKVSTAGSPP